MVLTRRLLCLLLPAALAACAGGARDPASRGTASPGDLHRGETPALRALIDKWAATYQVPPRLVHRVVQRESGYNPAARNGPYYGLMQINPATARTMGHAGPPEALLDADTNLRYGVKYLRGAWLVADGDMDRAVSWYARGYYYEARRRGMLQATGLRAG